MGRGKISKEAQTKHGLKEKLPSTARPKSSNEQGAQAGKWCGESKKLNVPNATAGSKKRSNNLPKKKTRMS